jgi:hypothetical protein
MSAERRFSEVAERIALHSDRFWIRCAAHSAEISVQGMPQTFSVYVLKKVSYSRRPKRLETHCSRLVSSRSGPRGCAGSCRSPAGCSQAQSLQRVAGLERVVEVLAVV